MRRTPRLPLVVLAACWLMAGPGGVTLQAIACPHHAATHQTHRSHDRADPPAAPCFCGEMTGGSDIALTAPAVAAVTAVSIPVPGHVIAVPFPLPPSPFPSFLPAPIPPPPDLRA